MTESSVAGVMRRAVLVAALLVGKGLDAVSTVVVLRLSDSVRETVPLSRALMAWLGPVGGMVVLTLITLAVVGLLAEAGVVVDRLLDGETPDRYAARLRATVYLGCAAWFALVGLWNLSLLV